MDFLSLMSVYKLGQSFHNFYFPLESDFTANAFFFVIKNIFLHVKYRVTVFLECS